MASSLIICPKCKTEIDIQGAVEQQLEQAYQKKIQEAQKKFQQEQEKLNQERLQFEEKKKQENFIFQQKLKQQLEQQRFEILQKTEQETAEKIKLQEQFLKEKLTKENEERFQLLEKEAQEKSDQLREFHRLKIENEKIKREKIELQDKIEAENAIKLNQILLEKSEEIVKREKERNELELKKLAKQLEDQKKLTEEMRRKQEQGSMQLQGEVQELALEEWLSAQFPLDNVIEIEKGKRGGDCLHIVNTRLHQKCGVIYYESKRTKEFSVAWIEKFKADIREKEANIGVLVTEAMPKDMQRMGLKDGIWICNFEEFKSLCAVLRESIIQLHAAVASQENKGDKMNLLYNYLTGTTFRSQVEAIVEGFSQLKNDLESEKRSMQNIWKKREKQIEKVMINTIEMHAATKGIAGNAVQDLNALELDHSVLALE